MNHSLFLGLKKGMSLAACLFVAGCAGNKAYRITPPPEVNAVKVVEKVEIKNKVSKPTKSFAYCRKLADSTADHPASLATLLLVPVDLIVLPYTAVYDLSPHFDVEKKISLKLEAKLVNASGVPLGDYPLTISRGKQSIKVNTDSNGLFTADLQNLAGDIGDKVRIMVLLSDADLAPFAKGQSLSMASPMGVEYLVTVGDGSILVERNDKYLRVKTGLGERYRDTLSEEYKLVPANLQQIVVTRASLSSEKNLALQKEEDLQQKEVENRQRQETLRLEREEELKKQQIEADRIAMEKRERLAAEKRLKKEQSKECREMLENYKDSLRDLGATALATGSLSDTRMTISCSGMSSCVEACSKEKCGSIVPALFGGSMFVETCERHMQAFKEQAKRREALLSPP